MTKHSTHPSKGRASAAAATPQTKMAPRPAERASKPQHTMKASQLSKGKQSAGKQFQQPEESDEEDEAEPTDGDGDEEMADGDDDAEDGTDDGEDEDGDGSDKEQLDADDNAEGEDEVAPEEDADAEEDDNASVTSEDRRMLEEEEAEVAEREEGEDEDEEGDSAAASAPVERKSKSPHALVVDTEGSAAYAAALANRGVIYLSRIPPYMKAAKLRWLLEQMVPKNKKLNRIGRIFLTPEDQASARRRKKAGGNSGKKFVDGWVEFESKKIARWIAETYNAQPMGRGPKRSRYAEDLWTLKYLKGFKWNHLTEKIAYEKQIRGTKIREEMSQAKRESEYYLGQVDRSKKIEQMELKKQNKGEKRKQTDSDSKDLGEQPQQKKQATQAPRQQHANIRTFHQRSLLDQQKSNKQQSQSKK